MKIEFGPRLMDTTTDTNLTQAHSNFKCKQMILRMSVHMKSEFGFIALIKNHLRPEYLKSIFLSNL